MGKINVYDKIVTKKEKKIWKLKKRIHKSPSKRRFWNEITCNSLLMRADARGALTPFTACDAYRYFARRALLMTSQK